MLDSRSCSRPVRWDRAGRGLREHSVHFEMHKREPSPRQGCEGRGLREHGEVYQHESPRQVCEIHGTVEIHRSMSPRSVVRGDHGCGDISVVCGEERISPRQISISPRQIVRQASSPAPVLVSPRLSASSPRKHELPSPRTPADTDAVVRRENTKPLEVLDDRQYCSCMSCGAHMNLMKTRQRAARPGFPRAHSVGVPSYVSRTQAPYLSQTVVSSHNMNWPPVASPPSTANTGRGPVVPPYANMTYGLPRPEPLELDLGKVDRARSQATGRTQSGATCNGFQPVMGIAKPQGIAWPHVHPAILKPLAQKTPSEKGGPSFLEGNNAP